MGRIKDCLEWFKEMEKDKPAMGGGSAFAGGSGCRGNIGTRPNTQTFNSLLLGYVALYRLLPMFLLYLLNLVFTVINTKIYERIIQSV